MNKEANEFSDRLNMACDHIGVVSGRGRIAELHRLCKKTGIDISSEAVRKWLEENAKPRMNNAVILAGILATNVEWLLTGRGNEWADASQWKSAHTEFTHLNEDCATYTAKPTTPSSEYIPIRRVKIKPSAGVTGYTVEDDGDIGNPIFFRADYLDSRGWNADRLIALCVNGASMDPSLYDNDLIVTHTGKTTPHEGHAFVLIYEGKTIIKRLRRDMGEWWLSSDNQDKRRYPDKRMDDEHARIIGEVVYKQSEII